MKNTEILNRIKLTVAEQAPFAKVYLYGSQARNEAKELSDWDILILMDKNKIEPETEKTIFHKLYDIEFDTGNIISPMLFSFQDWESKYKITPFYQNVMNDKIEL